MPNQKLKRLLNQVMLHEDWEGCGEDQSAITLLVFGKFQEIVDQGLARNLHDELFFDGLLNESFNDFDLWADARGYEL